MRVDPEMGELAHRLDAEQRLYRGAAAAGLRAGRLPRPPGARRRQAARAPLIVTSTVRDQRYQRLLERDNPLPRASTRCTPPGYAFDVRPDYASRSRRSRSSSCWTGCRRSNLIAWVREPGAIHITASGEDALQ